MTQSPDADRFADPAVAEAFAASNAEVAAILAEDLTGFGHSLAADLIVNSPLDHQSPRRHLGRVCARIYPLRLLRPAN